MQNRCVENIISFIEARYSCVYHIFSLLLIQVFINFQGSKKSVYTLLE